jgi:hypothetical protein
MKRLEVRVDGSGGRGLIQLLRPVVAADLLNEARDLLSSTREPGSGGQVAAPGSEAREEDAQTFRVADRAAKAVGVEGFERHAPLSARSGAGCAFSSGAAG